VGGVLGGVVGVGAIVLAVLYVRRTSGRVGQEAVTGEKPKQVVPLHPPTAPPTPDEKLRTRSSNPHSGPPPLPPKLYDPSDPSTFPPSIASLPPQGAVGIMPHPFGHTGGGTTAQPVHNSHNSFILPPNNYSSAVPQV